VHVRTRNIVLNASVLPATMLIEFCITALHPQERKRSPTSSHIFRQDIWCRH